MDFCCYFLHRCLEQPGCPWPHTLNNRPWWFGCRIDTQHAHLPSFPTVWDYPWRDFRGGACWMQHRRVVAFHRPQRLWHRTVRGSCKPLQLSTIDTDIRRARTGLQTRAVHLRSWLREASHDCCNMEIAFVHLRRVMTVECRGLLMQHRSPGALRNDWSSFSNMISGSWEKRVSITCSSTKSWEKGTLSVCLDDLEKAPHHQINTTVEVTKKIRPRLIDLWREGLRDMASRGVSMPWTCWGVWGALANRGNG